MGQAKSETVPLARIAQKIAYIAIIQTTALHAQPIYFSIQRLKTAKAVIHHIPMSPKTI